MLRKNSRAGWSGEFKKFPPDGFQEVLVCSDTVLPGGTFNDQCRVHGDILMQS